VSICVLGVVVIVIMGGPCRFCIVVTVVVAVKFSLLFIAVLVIAVDD
jgi:hypothetical protein